MPFYVVMIVGAAITAGISGMFGMAGGTIFMVLILFYLSVSEAMIVHGLIQSLSNGSRFWMLRQNIRWDILKNCLIGALPLLMILPFVPFQIQKQWVYFALAFLPLLLWFPRGWFQGDAEKPWHARCCGAIVVSLNLLAGVAGPALDYFYIKTGLTRQEIVATKAVTMFTAHLIKVVFYIYLAFRLQESMINFPPIWSFLIAIPAIWLGTRLGTKILENFSDVNFKSYTKYIVTVIGIYCLFKGMGWI